MLIYDKYLDSYYEVIPVKKIEEKIEQLEKDNKYYIKANMGLHSKAALAFIEMLQQLIEENCEVEE